MEHKADSNQKSNLIKKDSTPDQIKSVLLGVTVKHSSAIWEKQLNVPITMVEFHGLEELQIEDDVPAADRRAREQARRVDDDKLRRTFRGELAKAQRAFLGDLMDVIHTDLTSQFLNVEGVADLLNQLETGEVYRQLQSFLYERLADSLKVNVITNRLSNQKVHTSVRGFMVERKKLYDSLPVATRPPVEEQVNSTLAICGSKLPGGMQGLMLDPNPVLRGTVTGIQRLIDIWDSFDALNNRSNRGDSSRRGAGGEDKERGKQQNQPKWKCSCGTFNYSHLTECRRCKKKKDEGKPSNDTVKGLVEDNLKTDTNKIFTAVEIHEIKNDINNSDNHSVNKIVSPTFNYFFLPTTLLDTGASISIATMLTSDMKPIQIGSTWVEGLIAQPIQTSPFYHERLELKINVVHANTNIPYPLILSSGSMLQEGYRFFIDRDANWLAIKNQIVLVFAHHPGNRLLLLKHSFYVSDVNVFIQGLSTAPLMPYGQVPPVIQSTQQIFSSIAKDVSKLQEDPKISVSNPGNNQFGYYVTPLDILSHIPNVLDKYKQLFQNQKQINVVDIGAGTDARLGRAVTAHVESAEWDYSAQLYALEIDGVNAAQLKQQYPGITTVVGNCRETWVTLPKIDVAICNPNFGKPDDFLFAISGLNPLIAIYFAPSNLPSHVFAKHNLMVFQEHTIGPVTFHKNTTGLKYPQATKFSISIYVLGKTFVPPTTDPSMDMFDNKKYTKAQLEAMQDMLAYHRHLAHPPFPVMIDMFKRKTINFPKFSIAACEALHEIHQRNSICLGCAHDMVNVGFEETSRIALPPPGKTLHADIMLVTTTTGESIATLLAKEVVYGVRYAYPIPELNYDHLVQALKAILIQAKRHQHDIDVIVFDNQKGIEKAGINVGIDIRTGAKNQHSASIVEREIRTIKSHMARTLSALQFHVPAVAIDHLVAHIVHVLNYTPTKDAAFGSAQYVGSQPLDIVPYAFGDIGIVRKEKTSKELIQGMVVIYLRPDPIMKDVHFVLNIDTGKVMKRRKFKLLAPDLAKTFHPIINQVAGAQGWIDVDKFDDQTTAPSVAFTEWWLYKQVPKKASKKQNTIPNTEIPILSERVDYETLLAEDEENFHLDQLTLDANGGAHTVVSTLNQEIEESIPNGGAQAAHTVTSTLDQVFFAQEIFNDSLVEEVCFGINVAVPLKKAYQKYPNQIDEINQAVKTEMKQLFDLQTFEFFPHEKLTSDFIGKLVGVQLLVSEKTPNNFKARLVALGNQTTYTASPTSSPTGTRDTKMTLLNIAAHEKLSLMIVDGKNAYLQADYPGTAIARLPPFIVRIIQQEFPNQIIHVAPNGCAYAFIRKALYGLKESGRLFYEYQRNKLEENGFKVSGSDPCLFHRTEEGNKLSVIHVHVDDSLIASNRLDEIETIYRTIFREIKVQRSEHAKPIIHLNARMIQHENYAIEIDQEDYITKIAEKFNIAPSPTFTIRKVDPLSPAADAELYLQMVASFNYIQFRPETLEAFCELAHRQVTPTKNDMEDLKAVLGFLYSEKQRKLLIKPSSLDLFAITDASMGVIDDRHGIAGYIVSMGGSLIKAKAEKINVTALSSHENETIGILLTMKEVLYLRGLLEELGFHQTVTTIYTDCEPAMFAIGNGQAGTARTKHYAIKMARITEEIQQKHIRLEYQNTDAILADVLTKQTSPKKFRNFQNCLLSADIR